MIIELGLDITRNFQVRFGYYPNLNHNFFFNLLKKKSVSLFDFQPPSATSWLVSRFLHGFDYFCLVGSIVILCIITYPFEIRAVWYKSLNTCF